MTAISLGQGLLQGLGQAHWVEGDAMEDQFLIVDSESYGTYLFLFDLYYILEHVI